MTLVPWNKKTKTEVYDPFREFLDAEHPFFGLSLFPAVRSGNHNFTESFVPAIDVSEEKDQLVVKADLPGLKREDIQLSVEGSILTIKGERKSEDEKKDKNYHRVERSYGSFTRSLDLGSEIDQVKVKAQYKDGVLEVIVPKSEQSKPKPIEIEVK